MSEEQKAIEHAQKILRAVKRYDLADLLATPSAKQEPIGYFRRNGKHWDKLKGQPNSETLKTGWEPHYAAPQSVMSAPVAQWQIKHAEGDWTNCLEETAKKYERQEGIEVRALGVIEAQSVMSDDSGDAARQARIDALKEARDLVSNDTAAYHILCKRIDAAIKEQSGEAT